MENMNSLKSKSVALQIKEYLEDTRIWINGGDLERMIFITEKGKPAKPSNISKRLRELWTAEKIDKDLRDGSIWYRRKPQNIVEIAGVQIQVFARKKKKN